MAIRPVIKYPGQVQPASAAYPHGKAQNVTVVGDGTGTPLERDWVNDLWGFLQSLLSAGGVTPSGNPDEVGASDYLLAMRAANRVLLSPPQITSNQNNYSPTGWSEASVVRLSTNGLVGLNGLDSTAKVKTKLLINVGVNGLNLNHLQGGQAAGNQILAPSSVVYLLGPGDSALVDCDTTTGAWRIVGGASLSASRAWGGVHSWGASFLISGGTLSGTGSIDIDGAVESARFVIDHGSNEWDYKVARARVKQLPFNFVRDNPSASDIVWAPNTGNGAVSINAGSSIVFMDLPTGAVITGIFAGVTPGAGTVTLSARRELFNVFTGGIINTAMGAPAASSGGSYQLLDLGAMSVAVDNQLNRYSVSLQASAILQSCGGIWVSYTDPGPRSF